MNEYQCDSSGGISWEASDGMVIRKNVMPPPAPTRTGQPMRTGRLVVLAVTLWLLAVGLGAWLGWVLR